MKKNEAVIQRKQGIRKQTIIASLLGVLFLLSSTIADVPFVGYEEGRYLGNVETIGCLEFYKNPNPISISLWFGYAYVYPLQGGNYTHGYENAVEVRLKKNVGYLSSHLFISSYFGFGIMYLIQYYNGKKIGREWHPGLSAGIKTGYNFAIFEWKIKNNVSNISLEPYSGISFSKDINDNKLNNPFITFGIRIITNFKL